MILFLKKKLGKGCSSVVYRGRYNGQRVAVKVLNLENETVLKDFRNELEIISKVRNQYVVHFYGACFEPKICVVMELCENKSLWHYMKETDKDINWDLFFQWTGDIARGINVLHLWKPQIVHRDLKTLNILLDDDLKIKICDFGLSRYSNSDYFKTLTQLRGTIVYTSPELLNRSKYTPKSDVYSLGIIFWEITYRLINGIHQDPYDEYSYTHPYAILVKALNIYLRPTIPESTPNPIRSLIEECWHAIPDSRPTCAGIIVNLNVAQREYTRDRNVWNNSIQPGKKL